MTLGLGISHIWIDALCIVQDDERDKDHEIDKMGDIFESSTITILASRSIDVRYGFLYNPPILDDEELPWVFEAGGELGIRWHHSETILSKSITLIPLLDTQLAYYHEPLSYRGWALQEQSLARRTINFGLHDITWDCKQTQTSAFRENYKHVIRGEQPPDDHPMFWAACWAEFASDFTKLQLRFPEDRLPALAGIAQRWADGLDDEYVCDPISKLFIATTRLVLVRQADDSTGRGYVALHVSGVFALVHAQTSTGFGRVRDPSCAVLVLGRSHGGSSPICHNSRADQ